MVCVYNDQELLNNYLLKSLGSQDSIYQLILVDNTHNEYHSAADALNFGGKQATGSYIMFVHQDLELKSPDWLLDAEKVTRSLEKVGAVGAVGTRGRLNLSNMTHGHPPRRFGTSLYAPERVETLDECLAIIPQELFHQFQFDSEACPGWHFYVADYCLTLKKMGYQVYVIPPVVHHQSEGSPFSPDYFTTLARLMKKHAPNYKWINTTTGNWHTRVPLFLQKMYHQAYNFRAKKG